MVGSMRLTMSENVRDSVSVSENQSISVSEIVDESESMCAIVSDQKNAGHDTGWSIYIAS